MNMQTNAAGASTGSVPRKAVAVALSVVLALGLSPFGQAPAQAWADDAGLQATQGSAEAVAKVGDATYTTFLDALHAANAGAGVIDLLADATDLAYYAVGKDLTVNMCGHSLRSKTGNDVFLVTKDATLTIKGDESTEFYGRINVGETAEVNGNLVIDGGAYSCAQGNTVIHVDGDCTKCGVSIHGATITSPDDNGIQLNGGGTFSITDSTVSGYTAIYQKAGTLTLAGSTISATGETYKGTSINHNGSNPTGDAIVLDTTKGYQGDIGLKLLGPANKVESKSGSGILEATLEGDSSAVLSIVIEGGIVSGAVGKSALQVSDKFTRENASITGGMFSSDMGDYLADGYVCKQAGSSYVVRSNAAQAVQEMIDALPAEDAVTLADATAVAAARTALSVLPEDERASVDPDRLLGAETALDIINENAANAVSSQILALAPENPVAEAVQAARDAYNALTVGQKALVSPDTLKKLADAEAAIAAQQEQAAAEKAAADRAAADRAAAEKAAAEKAAADKKAADAVAGQIEGMDATSADAVASARSAYNALTDDQKKLVPDETYRKLTDAESALSAPQQVQQGDTVEGVAAGNATVDVTVTGDDAVTLTSATAKAGGKVSVNTVEIDGRTYRVTAIGAGAFKGTKAASVAIGANVRSIGKSAFANAKNLKSVTVGKNVTKIGKGAFSGAKKLKSVTLGKNVKKVGKGVFSGDKSLKKVTLKSGKLDRASFKNLLKGSQVKTVKLSGVSKKVKKSYAKWAPKGVRVS